MAMHLEASFSGPDRDAIARALLDTGLATSAEQVRVKRVPVVTLAVPDPDVGLETLRARLAEVPFELASFSSPFEAWRERWDGAPPFHGFADGHFGLGWACAFRGEGGHRRVLSRRWLAHGPWRLHRDANDTSFLELHALGADEATARTQAVPAHVALCGAADPGFVWSNPPLPARAPGDYLPSLRMLRVPVYGRALTAREMYDARVMVLEQALGPDRPLDTVRFAFADEREGRDHLHALWLRELECATFVNGTEVELTRDHAPSPPRLSWGD